MAQSGARFSFITGSCAYFNEPVYDRPGKPYGGDSIIFESMAKDTAAFALWLGDNWYTREVDLLSPWGLWYRASRDRAQPVLMKPIEDMPQYAIWDDHDYGPDNSWQFLRTERCFQGNIYEILVQSILRRRSKRNLFSVVL